MPSPEFKDIANKDPFIAGVELPGILTATGANYGAFFTARFPCEVMDFSAVWETASLSGTLQLEKLISGVAPGSGILLLTTAISTAGDANVPFFGALVIGSARQLARGDRLAIVDGGTLTNGAGLHADAMLKPLGKGHYAANTGQLL